MARHVIGLNCLAIGIENVCGVGGKHDLTAAQIKDDSYLACMLKCKYPGIKYLIGHLEYGRFRHTPLWKETNSKCFSIKTDPCPKFMKAVRSQVKSLGLLSSYRKGLM